MALNTDGIDFRVATSQDAPGIYRLVQSAFRGQISEKCWTTAAELLSGDRIDVPGIIAKIKDPSSAMLVVTDSNTTGADLVACCEVSRSTAQLAYFGLLSVSPDRQAGGIGKQVLAYAEDYCRQIWGTRRIELTVVWTRTELIQWYIRRGYRKTGEVPFPFEELGMTKETAPRENLYLDVMAKDLVVASGVAEEETP